MRKLSILLLAFLLCGCGKKLVSYHDQVQPILDNHCTRCHSSEKHRGKVVLASYEALMNSHPAIAGKQSLVVPGSSKESRLFVLCATNQPHFRMPPDTSGMTPLPQPELEVVMKWINQGAMNN